MTNICRLLILVLVSLGPQVQKHADSEQIWKDFMTWFRAAPLGGNPVQAYQAELQKKGISPEESQRQSATIMRLMAERPEGIAVYYDKIYSRDFSGDPEMDGFLSAPSAILIEATRGLKPAAALDAGMGQGRNALYLAGAGWNVTGFDVSDKGISLARASAEQKGLRINTVKATYDAFDYGVDKWDLIVMTFAWAPVSDPGFVRRIQASLRKGGKVVFEHFVRDAEHPYPEAIRPLEPGQLRNCFSGFQIERYEEVDGIGDWGGPGSRLVRMVAQKQ
jgi:2-polyprenyl-3-methyl-5-hydroxy-6-metoxy-1,4-benzoquinol methylase